MTELGKSDMLAPQLRPAAVLVFFLIAFGWSWGWWILGRPVGVSDLSDDRFTNILLCGSFGPMIAAFVASFVAGGAGATKSWLGSLIKFRAPWWCYLYTFLLLPLLALIAVTMLGMEAKIGWAKAAGTLVIAMVPNAIIGGIVFGQGPLGEEPGWRGWLQPAAEKRSLFWAPVFLGIIWAAWHAPLFGFESFRQGIASIPIWLTGYTISLIAASCAFGALYRWSRGSVPICVFAHAVLNITAASTSRLWAFDSSEYFFWFYVVVLTIFGVITVCVDRLLGSRKTA